MNWLGTIVRFIVSAIVYLLVSYLVPGFQIAGFWSAIIAAIVVSLIGWGVEALFGPRITNYGRGIVGFIVSAVILYVAQWVVPGMRVTALGAIIASLVIGIIDLFIPLQRPGVPSDR
ncbi:MAG: phage holin family protein [Alicyclobacillus sp.]|nr:phage holin family protein [Alicyclobacillus sp.]